jgi:hypothetical protein
VKVERKGVRGEGIGFMDFQEKGEVTPFLLEHLWTSME